MRARRHRLRPRSGCATSRPRSSRTPSERKLLAPRAAASPRAHGIRSVSGYQRSARSQTRCLPRRPTTATSPRAFSTPSIRPILRCAPPAVRLAPARRVILDLAREQRAAPLELAQDVAAERRVLLQVRDRAGGRAAGRAGACAPGGAAGPRPARGTRSTRRACRSSQSSRSSSPRSNGPSRLQSTRCCGGATVEIGSSCRKPSRRTVLSTSVAEPSSSCARTAIRRASSTLTSLGFTRCVLPARARGCARAALRPARASRRRCRAPSARGVNRRIRSTPSARSAFRSARPRNRSPASSGST